MKNELYTLLTELGINSQSEKAISLNFAFLQFIMITTHPNKTDLQKKLEKKEMQKRIFQFIRHMLVGDHPLRIVVPLKKNKLVD